MGIAPVVRRGERLSARRLLAAPLATGAVLLATTGCRPPLEQDAVSAFYLAIEKPREVEHLRGGSLSDRGHDVWVCFESREPVKLRDEDRFRPVDPREWVGEFEVLCPDESLREPEMLKAVSSSHGGRATGSGKVLLSDPFRGKYFLRSWRSDPG